MSEALAELSTLGRALGAFQFVQGPGGNVSIKDKDWLYIKASGKRLTEIDQPDGFARASLPTALRGLEGSQEAEQQLFSTTPRPSLETYFHALGARVVAHTHPLGTLLYACSSLPVMPGLPVREIPYVRPGRALALAVRSALDLHLTEQTVLLRSHGLLVFAPSVERAIALTRATDEALRSALPMKTDPESAVRLCEQYRTFSSVRPTSGGFACELPSRREPPGHPRYLFPDAAICCTKLWLSSEDLDRPDMATAAAISAVGRSCILRDTGGRRWAAARTRLQLDFALEVLAAHDWLEDQLAAAGLLHPLPEDEPAKLLNLPAEQHRIRLSGMA